MKLNIQLFAQTILDNEQSSTSSPTAYYTIEATPSNRITDKVDITIVVKSHLGSNQSSLGTGPSMGLEAHFTFNGNQNRSLVLKDTGESWTGTTEHTASVTYTITTNSPTQNSMTCSVHIYRTGSAAGSSSKGAQLWETNCSNITIPIVPASTITSVSSGTTNYAPSVVFTPKDATFKYKIKYSLNSWNYTTGFITPNTTSTYTYNSYTITTATLAPYLTNATSGTATATLYTYDSSGTQLGDPDSKTFTITLNSSVVPSVTIGTITEANATMQSLNWGVFVQNKSQLNIPITATGIYNSTITSVVTTINGKTFNGTNVTTTTLVTAGTNTISTTITDSRGRTATATKTYSVVAYANPTITTAQVQRCLSDGTLSDEGTYLLYSFVGSISSVSNHNAKTFKLGYKKTTDANYTYVTLSSNYTINNIDTISSFTINQDYSYDIVFQAIDSFTTTAINRSIDTGFDLMNFNASGKAMAIGKVSEAGANEELLEIDLPTNITQELTTTAFNGRVWDFTTGNSTDTWVPVAGSNGKWQHRAIPTAYSNSPDTLDVNGAKQLRSLASVTSGNTANRPWHLIMKTNALTPAWRDTEAIIMIRSFYLGGPTGILKVALKGNNTSNPSASVTWLSRYGFNMQQVCIGLYNGTNGNGYYADVYVKRGTYARCEVVALRYSSDWQFVNSNEADNGASYTNVYANAGTTGMSRNYSSIIYPGEEYGRLVTSASATNTSSITLSGLDLEKDYQYEIWVSFSATSTGAMQVQPNGKNKVTNQHIQDCRVNNTNYAVYNRVNNSDYLYSGDITASGQSTLLVYKISQAVAGSNTWFTVQYQMSNVGGTTSNNTTTWGGGQFKISDSGENITSITFKNSNSSNFNSIYARCYRL